VKGEQALEAACSVVSMCRANTWCVICTVPRVPNPPLRATSSGATSPGACALLLLLGSACATIPSRRFAIDSISVTGNSALDDADILDHIATRETPRFLAVFQGVMFDYEVFDRYVLERDLQRIERYYRSRGFYRAHVRAGRVTISGQQKVSVEIVVEEGPPTYVGRVDVHGVEGLDPALVEEAEAEVTGPLGVGDIFEEETFDVASENLQRLFADNGHAYVRVKRAADVDVTRDLVSLGYWVEAGPVVKLGPIDIKGLDGIP
jgi:outer membrane protein assembly factor BamA